MRMQRLSAWTICLAVSSLLPALRAQQPTKPPATEFVVSPRAVEQPLLKHRLFPAEYELKDGNAAPIILRLAWEQTQYFVKVVPTFEEHLKLPLTDPKLTQDGPLFKTYFYEELRRAAYRRTAHWEYPIGEEQTLSIRLPDVQAARQIAGRGLSTWIRYQIALGELDKAEEAIKVGFAVNRHYARTPFVVTNLVTVALNNLLLQRLEELIAQPDAANYYWALTALPRPLVDIQPAQELLSRSLQLSTPGLDRLDESRTAEQWAEIDRMVFQLYFSLLNAKPPTEDEIKVFHGRAVERARADLPTWIEGGNGRVTAMTDAEAVVRWLVEQHRRHSDEIVATSCLEPNAALPALRALQDRLTAFRDSMGFAGLLLAETPLNVYLSQRALERRIDALRTLEAIRHYAATHSGKFPDSLAQITDTPVPNDLLTSQPFQYERVGAAAVLSAPGIPVAGGQVGAVNYRITLRNAKPAPENK